jgi:hypothetical protein
MSETLRRATQPNGRSGAEYIYYIHTHIHIIYTYSETS